MRALLLSLLTGLAGCASISYSPVQMDSPRPVEGTSPRMCASTTPVSLDRQKRGPAASLVLNEGHSCVFVVRADRMLSLTPLATEAGQVYRVTVPRNQVWYDASRRNVPPDGESGSMIMNLLAHRKQHDTGWFALFAANVARDSGARQECFDVSVESEIVVKAPGQLAFYPNDATAVFREDYFYSNNHGQVWLQIQRLRDEPRRESRGRVACPAASGR